MKITKTKTVILDKDATKLYTVMDNESDLYGTSYKANTVQEVGEYLLKEIQNLKGWTLKTPCYESKPIRTAGIEFYRKVNVGGLSDEVRCQKLGFWVEDLTPAPPAAREWPELNADEKLEVLKRELMKTGICANFTEVK